MVSLFIASTPVVSMILAADAVWCRMVPQSAIRSTVQNTACMLLHDDGSIHRPRLPHLRFCATSTMNAGYICSNSHQLAATAWLGVYYSFFCKSAIKTIQPSESCYSWCEPCNVCARESDAATAISHTMPWSIQCVWNYGTKRPNDHSTTAQS